MTELSSEHFFLKGRGAQVNPQNPFHAVNSEPHIYVDDSEDSIRVTQKYIETYPKTILNKVESPDIGLNWSMNPYQGCEHGCVYCYARNTHKYWGYSAGLDFESIILVKRNAPELLSKALRAKRWQGDPIMLSGNTDCYQPVERKLEITRRILQILWEKRHPVGIITKNQLILRDLDILQKMAEHNLVKVSISLNTLQEDLRQKLEPRTTSSSKRLDTIRKLSHAGVPVNVMMAPIIPGLNSHEIFEVLEAVSEAGAKDAHYIVVRLNDDVATIFEDWLRKTFPDRADKVLSQIAECHGGKVSDSRFKVRMKGEGRLAEIINSQFHLAKRKFLSGRSVPGYNTAMFHRFKDPQLSLFG